MPPLVNCTHNPLQTNPSHLFLSERVIDIGFGVGFEGHTSEIIFERSSIDLNFLQL